MLKRYLSKQLEVDLKKKMVLLAGPRQCGKTTLARGLLTANQLNDGAYLNWDDPNDQRKILKRELPLTDLWVFDEIHKYRGWRNYLKGLYDKKKATQRILVTGSAKLDWYRYGGDSLQGRYQFLRLHPFTLAEVLKEKETARTILGRLFELGNFPEPFLANDKTEADRWTLQYKRRLIREDIRSLENLQDFTKLELLAEVLPERVGSPLSINSLREDLEVAHKTVAHWLEVLEKNYLIFRIAPFGAPKLRTVKKEQKHYHFDWNVIQDEGPRFENLIACHLLKWVHFQEDIFGKEYELRYFRNTGAQEVDFIISKRNEPLWAIEVKLGDEPLSSNLKYFCSKFPKCEGYQLHLRGKKSYQSPEGIKVIHASEFLIDLV